METLELKCHNYPFLYKEAEKLTISSSRFLECRKCNILVATQALVHCLICPHTFLGTAHHRCCAYKSEAMHSCLCYNYYMYINAGRAHNYVHINARLKIIYGNKCPVFYLDEYGKRI